jgi:hypothetical protein
MSVGLKSYSNDIKLIIARRRANSTTTGLGYWGAVDAIKKVAEKK